MTLNRTPDLAEVLRVAMDNRLSDLHVALPGRVEKYDLAQQSADIKPLIKRAFQTADGTEVLEELPVISQVPIVFPRAGGFFISLPIKKGDLVTLLFCERSIDKYTKGTGKDTDPVDLRQHELIDAVAFPGFYPFSEAIAEASGSDMVVGHDGGMQMTIDDAGAMALAAVGAATQAVALATKVQTELGNVQTAHNTHIHITTATIGPSAVPGVIAPPVIVYTPGTVGSSKVTAEE